MGIVYSPGYPWHSHAINGHGDGLGCSPLHRHTNRYTYPWNHTRHVAASSLKLRRRRHQQQQQQQRFHCSCAAEHLQQRCTGGAPAHTQARFLAFFMGVQVRACVCVCVLCMQKHSEHTHALAAEYLKRTGYQCTTACGPQKALGLQENPGKCV